MKIAVACVLLGCTYAVSAYDCFGRNNSCTESHETCDTGYDPYCEHLPGPQGKFFGICTCDKDCKTDSDCTNTQADGCPSHAPHPRCETTYHVCVCFPEPPGHFNQS